MKILVLYFSKTGNTLATAQAVARGVERVETVKAVLRNTREITKEDFLAADGIVVGSPVYYGTMASELKKVFEDFDDTRAQMENKIGAVFTTSENPTGGKETTMLSMICAMLIYGMVIVGDPIVATGHFGTACVGKPDTKTEQNAEKLGERVASLALRLRSTGLKG